MGFDVREKYRAQAGAKSRRRKRRQGTHFGGDIAEHLFGLLPSSKGWGIQAACTVCGSTREAFSNTYLPGC